MVKKIALPILVLVAVASLWTACGSSEPAGGGGGGETALTVAGAPNAEWSMDALRDLGTIEVDYTNKDGETTTYTGVPIKTVLDAAGVEATDGTLVFVAADGYTADIALADVLACDNCVIAFDGDGLRSVLPEQSGKVQVRDLVEIRVE